MTIVHRAPSRLGWALIVSAWCATSEASAASALDDLIADARSRGLHATATWQRLLYYRDGESEVTSADFFLAADGRRSAQAELEATLAGWFEEGESDAHPRCRFPARYLWLAGELDLPHQIDPACARFQAWARLDAVESISALMVSGYLGNPASSFGHSLLRIQRSDRAGGGSRLLDSSFSFGALVPKGENAAMYVLRGLDGSYQAAFSDRLFYARDQVYTRRQFRDIWEYRLALDPAQRRLLVSHLWEVQGRTFTYYFLNKNCGQRMAELLALATGRDLAPDPTAWYAPAELFHDLMGPVGGDGALVTRIEFFPSSQRVVRHRFAELDDEERAVVNRVIASEGAELERDLEPLRPESKRHALDVLALYYEYRLVPFEEGEALDLRATKDAVLLARLRLPPSHEPEVPVPALPPITERHPPFALGGAIRSVDGDEVATLSATAYRHELADDPASGTGLAVGEVEVDVDADGDVGLDHLDLINVRRMQISTVDLHGEGRSSWQVRAGWRRDGLGDVDARAEVSSGVGRAAALGEATLGYALVGLAVRDGTRSGPTSVRTQLEPMLGLVHRSGPLSLELELAGRVDLDGAGWASRSRFVGGWRLGRFLSLRLAAERMAGRDAVLLGFATYR